VPKINTFGVVSYAVRPVDFDAVNGSEVLEETTGETELVESVGIEVVDETLGTQSAPKRRGRPPKVKP